MLTKIDDAFFLHTEQIIKATSTVTSTDSASWKEFDTEFNTSGAALSAPPPKKNGQPDNGSKDFPTTGEEWRISSEKATNILMVGFGQIAVWPVPSPGASVYFPFYGESLHFSIASDIMSTYGANLSLIPLFSSMNLVSILGPYGLLQHLWILWEMVATGKDIVVVASTPTQVCNIFSKYLILFTVV
jgi:hypothetical protein